jgi:glycosyltransferase involved in cell wall biosynthesis
MNDIEVSVVMPCLNEEEALGACLKKIKEVFALDGIRGEIVVADNGSTDRSREIALAEGAVVVTEQKKGYGAAYLCGLKEAKGRYIVIGDSDNSYDFYDIPVFLSKLREGYDFVIGSRFKGGIKKGAMSWSHRYIGNPILSFMTRLFFHTKLSDIHCGMRAFTIEAYRAMRLQTAGMEFATEMVVSALTNNLKVYEVPIHYYPRKGESKLNPFTDAWRHIRFMLLYCPVWLYFIPGAAGFIIGMTLLLLLLKGPFLFLGHMWDLHLMVFASMISILSYQILNLGIYAHTFAIRQGFLKFDKLTRLLERHFNLEKGLIVGGVIFLVGFVMIFLISLEWFSKYFGALYRIRESILAMTLLVIGLQTVFSSFFVSLLFLEKK